LPFRKAHHITGEIVKIAEARSVPLDRLELNVMQQIEPLIRKDIFDVLNAKSAINQRAANNKKIDCV
jgi:argininosuccinate lyase